MIAVENSPTMPMMAKMMLVSDQIISYLLEILNHANCFLILVNFQQFLHHYILKEIESKWMCLSNEISDTHCVHHLQSVGFAWHMASMRLSWVCCIQSANVSPRLAATIRNKKMSVTLMLDTFEGVSLSELVAFVVLVADIPSKVLLIHTVGVTISESVDECVQAGFGSVGLPTSIVHLHGVLVNNCD